MKFFSSFLILLLFYSPLCFINTVASFAPKGTDTLKVYPFEKGTIQLQIENIQEKRGTIKVALFNSEETFLIDDAAYLTNSTDVTQNNTVTINFTDIPYGTYSVAIFHDVNGNNQMDKNLFGMPKEPYGFSNNARSKWGPPKYEAAKFQLDQADLVMQIAVKTWRQQ